MQDIHSFLDGWIGKSYYQQTSLHWKYISVFGTNKVLWMFEQETHISQVLDLYSSNWRKMEHGIGSAKMGNKKVEFVVEGQLILIIPFFCSGFENGELNEFNMELRFLYCFSKVYSKFLSFPVFMLVGHQKLYGLRCIDGIQSIQSRDQPRFCCKPPCFSVSNIS